MNPDRRPPTGVYLLALDRYADFRVYKTSAIDDFRAEGYSVDCAYGNAQTDAQSYADASVPLDRTFMIGDLAGIDGTVAIDADGYSRHISDFVDQLPAACAR